MDNLIRKSFSGLDDEEKQAVYKLVLQCNHEDPPRSFEALNGYYSGPVFNRGETLFTFWKNSKPVITIGTIVKDVIHKNEVFISAINADKDYLADFSAAVQDTENFIRELKPAYIKLGFSHNKNYLIPYVERLGFTNPYHLYEMSFIPPKKAQVSPAFSMESLSKNNKELYKKINNSAFSTCPNGGIISMEDIDNFISDYSDKPELIGIFKYNGQPVGTFELLMDNITGIIEAIGIDNKEQGKGYGKILLEAAIKKLQEHGAEKIRLNVIDNNTVAFNIYLKYGFTKDKILSDWFEKKL